MLRVTAIELPARWGDPERPLSEVEALLTRGPETDLVLLPEQSLSGYMSPAAGFDLAPFAEALGGPTTARLAELARAHRVHLVAPLVERADECLYNTMIALDPEGRVLAAYRKRHPWYVETWATPGDAPLALIDVGEARCAIAICFDVHFLAAESASELGEADVLLFPSAWVERVDSRPALFADLAARFEVAIVNANWGRGVPTVYGQGGSRVVARDGTTIARAPDGLGPHRVDAALSIPARR